MKAPAENKIMKRAALVGISTTTAFGHRAPGNLRTGFGLDEPFWLVDLANLCVVLHIVGAFQVKS